MRVKRAEPTTGEREEWERAGNGTEPNRINGKRALAGAERSAFEPS